MTSPLRALFLSFLLGLAAFPALGADEPAKAAPTAAASVTKDTPAAAKPPEPEPAGSGVITLPAVQVTSSRIREIDRTLKRIDKQISRERNKLKSTETDRVLNHDQVARATALFGGKSTAQREAVAAERVRLFETERDLLEQMKSPMMRDDFLLVEKQVELLRTARRELDLVYR